MHMYFLSLSYNVITKMPNYSYFGCLFIYHNRYPWVYFDMCDYGFVHVFVCVKTGQLCLRSPSSQ